MTPTRLISDLTLERAASLAASGPAKLRQFHAARLADLQARAERQRATVKRESVFSRFEKSLTKEN